MFVDQLLLVDVFSQLYHLTFMFVDQLLLVDVFSQLYHLTYAKKIHWRTSVINHEKSIISIDAAI